MVWNKDIIQEYATIQIKIRELLDSKKLSISNLNTIANYFLNRHKEVLKMIKD